MAYDTIETLEQVNPLLGKGPQCCPSADPPQSCLTIQVESNAEAEEKWDKEHRFLGSRRLYHLKEKAKSVVQKPIARKNHPGETWNPSQGHR